MNVIYCMLKSVRHKFILFCFKQKGQKCGIYFND
eukprot:UN12565